MTILLIIIVLCGSPEARFMTLSGDEFLFKWNSVGWIPEDFESSKASFQGGVPVKPLVMDDT